MNKKTIWITGGSTGIGKALAIKFANEGWNVAISARRENLLKEISETYENIHSFPLDVTCLLYTSPSPRDLRLSRMPSSA